MEPPSIFDTVDELKMLSERIQNELICWHGNEIEMNQLASQQTKDFINTNDFESRRTALRRGLNRTFGSYNETELKGGLGRILIENMNEVFTTTFYHITNMARINIDESNRIINNVKPSDMTERENRIRNDTDFLLNLHDIYYWHCEVIINSIRYFLPDEYNRWSPEWSKYIKCGDPLSNGQETSPTEPGAKLKWKSNPSVTGYIVSELIRAGYIEPPITNGELSYAKLAVICNQIFDIRSDGKPTTLDYLKKVVNPESNQLPDHKRAKLKLPDLDQLT